MNSSRSNGAIAQLLDGRDGFLTFVQRRIGDPELAEDVLKNSLLKAVEGAPRLHDDESVVPWFYTVLRNSIVDAYRRRAAESRLIDAGPLNDVPGDEERQRQQCRCFESLIPQLKREYREIIRRLDLAGEPADAVAAQFGISAANLKVRRHRACRALRRRLEETCGVCAQDRCLDCTCRSERATAE